MIQGTLCELRVENGVGRTVMFVPASQLQGLKDRGLVLREYAVPMGNQPQHQVLMDILLGTKDERVAAYFASLLSMVHSWGCQKPQMPGNPPDATE